MPASPFPTLPIDLIFQILYYSDPRDIIQWRTVSKGLNAITHKTTLWKALYRNVPFPCPPGPFSTQSVSSLERSLVKAAQLAESWTTRPMRALSSLKIKTGRTDYAPLKFISGRWLVMFESGKRFVLYDADPVSGNYTQQVLWEQEAPQVSEWVTGSTLTSEGLVVVYVLFKLRSPPPGCWKLLEIRLNHDTGELLHSATMDPPQTDGSDISFRVSYVGNSQLLFIPGSTKDQMVLDTRTHAFYKVTLPAKVPSKAYSCLDWIILSDTILAAFHRSKTKITVYVFALAHRLDGAAGQTNPWTLVLTHKGVTNAHLSEIKFMKPITNLATGETIIRLLDYSNDLKPLELRYVEMRLPKHSLGTVLSINIETRSIELPRERVRLSRYESHHKCVDVSDDGQIRGFLRVYNLAPSRPWNKDENLSVMKFSIDTTQDPWVIERSQIVPAEWSNEVDPSPYLTGSDVVFDGMCGRLCYAHADKSNIHVVADIE